MRAFIASRIVVFRRSAGARAYVALVSDAGIKDGCPHCYSLLWTRIRRNWWQKLFHPHQNLCHCRTCWRTFWQDY